MQYRKHAYIELEHENRLSHKLINYYPIRVDLSRSLDGEERLSEEVASQLVRLGS